MEYMQGSFPVICKENLAKDCYSLWVYCPEMAAAARPGQFAHLRVEGFSLRRPVSICEIDRERGRLRFVFAVRGGGTAALARFNAGESLDLIAPLGTGFTLAPGKRVALVGGGIGTPPLLALAHEYGADATAILGFQTASAVILASDFRRAGANTLVCTDDGSAGVPGLVTGPLETLLQKGGLGMICACGPRAMLRAVAELAARYAIPCEISLEERMGCGVGACLVCACKCVKDGREWYAHVCKDGPVFPAEQVEWKGRN